MTTDASFSAASHEADTPVAHAWQRGLLWLGTPLCLVGLATTGIAAQWRGGRFAELIALALISLVAAAVLRRSLQYAARHAEGDANGVVWAELLRRADISDVLVRPATSTPAQQAALTRVSAVRQRAIGDLEWWRIPAEGAQ